MCVCVRACLQAFSMREHITEPIVRRLVLAMSFVMIFVIVLICVELNSIMVLSTSEMQAMNALFQNAMRVFVLEVCATEPC